MTYLAVVFLIFLVLVFIELLIVCIQYRKLFTMISLNFFFFALLSPSVIAITIHDIRMPEGSLYLTDDFYFLISSLSLCLIFDHFSFYVFKFSNFSLQMFYLLLFASSVFFVSDISHLQQFEFVIFIFSILLLNLLGILNTFISTY